MGTDHSPGIEIAVAAVALGAQIIEKHFSRDMPGPDHRAFSNRKNWPLRWTPSERGEGAGKGVKAPAREMENIAVARKSLSRTGHLRG